MNKVFCVQGCRGEYSDRSEWAVRAFATREEAEAFRLLCAAEATRVNAEDDALEAKGGRWEERAALVSKYDARCQGDRWGDTAYGVVEVPFGPVLT